VNVQKQNGSLLARIQAVQPSSNPRAYLPASLSDADRSWVNTARAAGREREAIDRFMVSLNVAPLSAQFRNAIGSQEREKAKEIKAIQEEQTVDAACSGGSVKGQPWGQPFLLPPRFRFESREVVPANGTYGSSPLIRS
jgi:hypothetical protein